jgi:transposase-like protein
MDFTKMIKQLSSEEKAELARLLHAELSAPKLQASHDAPVRCPHCQGVELRGHGLYKGRRRYLCQGCGKTFNDFTGTAVAGIKKVAKFEAYLALVVESVTIRRAAAELGVNVKTAFDWRHKLLSCLSAVNGEAFTGIVECDDKQLDISQKGCRKLGRKPYKRHSDRQTKRGVSNDKVSIMVATDRNGKPTMQVAKIGRVDVQSIDRAIGKFVQQGTVLCSDANPSIIAWAAQRQLEHHTFVATKRHVKDKCYHVQHVNSIDNRYERWVSRFYGVATKYLRNYLSWFVFLEKMKQSAKKAFDLAKIAVANVAAMTNYRTIDEFFANLLCTQYSKT